MLFQRNRKPKNKSNTLPQKAANDIQASHTLSPEDKLRRELYERIAQGNALAEIEESIHGRWSR